MITTDVTLQWDFTPEPDTVVDAFRIYKNSALLATVSATISTYQVPAGETVLSVLAVDLLSDVYTITAVVTMGTTQYYVNAPHKLSIVGAVRSTPLIGVPTAQHHRAGNTYVYAVAGSGKVVFTVYDPVTGTDNISILSSPVYPYANTFGSTIVLGATHMAIYEPMSNAIHVYATADGQYLSSFYLDVYLASQNLVITGPVSIASMGCITSDNYLVTTLSGVANAVDSTTGNSVGNWLSIDLGASDLMAVAQSTVLPDVERVMAAGTLVFGTYSAVSTVTEATLNGHELFALDYGYAILKPSTGESGDVLGNQATPSPLCPALSAASYTSVAASSIDHQFTRIAVTPDAHFLVLIYIVDYTNGGNAAIRYSVIDLTTDTVVVIPTNLYSPRYTVPHSYPHGMSEFTTTDQHQIIWTTTSGVHVNNFNVTPYRQLGGTLFHDVSSSNNWLLVTDGNELRYEPVIGDELW